jgi:ketosteroid isomerase-like protein
MITITDSAVGAEIARRENEWMDAWLRRDMQAAANILADEFTLTSSLSSGEQMTKAQWLAGAASTHAVQAYHFDRIDVRVYGEAALANIWYHQQATVRGNDWSGNFLMSDLWVRRAGSWQVVARHASWLKPA